jgi:hypothetical protein
MLGMTLPAHHRLAATLQSAGRGQATQAYRMVFKKIILYRETKMDEQVVLEEGNVKVTNSRFMVAGQTYAMNGVTSVEQFVQKPARVLPIMIGIFGVCALAGSVVFGAILIAAAVAIWVIQKKTFSVLLSTASGKARALTSKDEQYISRVVAALNNAIISRG